MSQLMTPLDTFCGLGEGWGPISPDRLDLTPCFKFSVFYGIVSIAAIAAFILRIVYLRRKCKSHQLGRTAWIYWPSQLCMTIVGSIGLVKAVQTLLQTDGTPATAFGYFFLGVAWSTAVILNHFEHLYKIRSSDLIFSFYMISFTSCLVVLYPGDNKPVEIDEQFKVTLTIMVWLLFGFVIEAWPRNGTRVQQLSDASDYDKANLFSRSTIEFFQPIISLSLKRTITFGDIQNQLPEDKKTSPSHDELDLQWRRNVEKWNSRHQSKSHKSHSCEMEEKPQVSLFWTILQVRARSMIPIVIFRIVRPLLLFSIPGLLSLLLEYLQDAGTERAKGLAYGLLLAGAIFAAAFFGAIIQAVSRLYAVQISLKTKVALTSMVYRKALRLSPESKSKSTTGEIMNHMSVDADTWTEGFQYLAMWISLPIEISAAMWLLYRLLGWSFLAGIAALLAMAPLQIYRARVFNKLKKDRLKVMDERVRLTTECLSAIKVVKLYCWQSAFKSKILEVRDRELEAMRRLGVIYSAMSIIFTSSTLFICLLTLSVYATWGGEGFSHGKLTPQTVFVSMTLFSMLRTPIGSMAEATSITLAAIVATKRIENFLLLEEIREDDVIKESGVPDDGNVPLVSIENGTFFWNKHNKATVSEENEDDDADERRPLLSEDNGDGISTVLQKPTLENINFSVFNKSLTAVVGRVGQGKSSLLSAIIGEMYKSSGTIHTHGQIAYVPQHAWILNCSLRDNILFGKSYDEARYRHILYACGLEPDIAMLPAKDLTEIGERGINLSGGQKQRVSLARAAYSNSDIYLLDDPLSAVDAHVDKHLWRHLIGPKGLLKDKTRILVTHGIHHLKEVDKVVMIRDGKINSQGSYPQLIAEKQLFYQLIKEYALTKRENDSESSTAGPSTEVNTDSRPASEFRLENYEDDRSSTDSLNTVEGDVILSTENTNLEAIKNALEEENAKASTKGRITEEEKMKEGSVGWGPYLAYIRACSYKYAVIVVSLHILAQGALVGTNLWLKYWIKSSEEDAKEGDETAPSLTLFLSVFTLLTMIYVLMYIVLIYIMFTKAIIRASRIIHNNLISKIFRLPSSFFDTTPLGRIINRFSSDIQSTDDQLPWSFDSIMMFSASVAASMIIVTFTTPSFLLALPFFIVIILAIQRMYLYSSRAIKRIFHVSKSPIYQHFNETLGGVSTIRAMRLQDRFIQENVVKIDFHTNAHTAYIYCIRWVEVRLQCLSAVIILMVAVTFVLKRDTIDPATAGLAMSFALTITGDINFLVRAYCELQNRLVPVERVHEYIDLPTEAPEKLPLPQDYAGSSLTWPPKHGRIVFDDYSTRYREGLDLVLKNISFEVQAGERVGIVGRTGAGKSSLTLALFRMIEAANSHWAKATNLTSDSNEGAGGEEGEYGGRIEIDGVDISTLGLVDLRQSLAIIPQDPVLFAGSVRDNLDPFNEHSDHTLWKSLERAHLKPYIQSLPGGLSFVVSQNGENFSVGQRSLICLARALLRKTKILILDEATSAVDVETDELIQRTIREEFKDRTILTIAHRIKTVMDSDKILVLEQGQVVEFDRPEALLQRRENSLFYLLAEQAGEI